MSRQMRVKDTGIPSGNGGQYAEHPAKEPANVRLDLTDDEYNADGSFYYPPVPRSAAQMISFWSTIQIPDKSIDQLVDHYYHRFDAPLRELREQRIQEEAQRRFEKYVAEGDEYEKTDEFQRSWKASIPQERENYRTATAINREEARQRFLEEARNEVPMPGQNEVPPSIWPEPKRTEWRALARAGGLYAYTVSSNLDDAERAKIMEHRVTLADGSEPTVREIEERYRIHEIRRYLTDVKD